MNTTKNFSYVGSDSKPTYASETLTEENGQPINQHTQESGDLLPADAHPMNRDWVVAIGLAAFLTGGCAPSAPNQPDAQPGATLLFAGARLILGDGGVIENGALLVEGNRVLEVGSAGEVTSWRSSLGWE